MKLLKLTLAFSLLSGCVTRMPISWEMPSMILGDTQSRRTTRGFTVEMTFPPGEYRPVLLESRGVYYENVARPGLYVLVASDGRHAIWQKSMDFVDWLNAPLPFVKKPAAP